MERYPRDRGQGALMGMGACLAAALGLALALTAHTARAVDTNFARGGLKAGMVYVPAGTFIMGSDSRSPDETPEHVVYLDAFFIDRFEVTRAAYQRCVDAGVCSPPKPYPDETHPLQPVVGVTWQNANTYCRWAGGRLPTEAEWEKAARGEDGRLFPWGNAIRCGDANFGHGGGSDECPDAPGHSAKVGSYPRDVSPYGAFDMGGNVWEHVSDYYSATYYNRSPHKNPTGPRTGKSRVLKGGSWYTGSDNVAASSRIGRSMVPHPYDGFRCAREAP